MRLSWQDKVKKTARIHKGLLREKGNHTIRDTANLLDRSLGAVSQDLTLYSWMTSHPKVGEFGTAKEALQFVKQKKREIKLR